MSPGRLIFAAAYAASGAAALVYEVTWTRLLTLLLGQSTAAASTVLAAMMGGLAAGAWLGSRLTHDAGAGEPARPQTLLRRFAILEAATAGAAVLLPLALSWSVPLLAWAYADAETPVRFAVVRGATAVLLVGLPAVAMGATFPLAVGWFARSPSAAGVLYAVNTAGAAVGALAAGFWWLPALGIRATTGVAVALNGLACVTAWWLSARPEAREEPAVASAPRPAVQARAKGPRRSEPVRAPVAAPAVAMAAAGLSGFIALAHEVVWTRLIALVIGPTTYAFATVVAAFVIGIALGAGLGARIVRRTRRPIAWLGAFFFIGAVAAVLAGWVAATRLPLLVAEQVAANQGGFAPVLTRQVVSAIVLLLPLTCALGAAFPLALAVADPRQVTGGAAARVYAANTVGAITGALAAGFVLLPAAGLHDGLRLTAGLGLACAAAAWLYHDFALERARARAWWQVATATAIGAALVVLPPWDERLLAAGAYKYAPYLGVAALENELRAWQLLYYKDGASASVGVRELAGMRAVVIDGKVDASNMGDMLTQRLLGLLPVLLHGRAEDVLVIGLGSGVTLASTLAPGTVQRADVVEISPEVVRASAFFARENGDVLASPAVRLVVGDGRSHLKFSTRRYDVIVSEPSNPWMAGIAPLFTREFFESAAARLKPGGVICQWAHTYDISAGDLRSIVRTFASVFPQATMWLVGDGDLLLIGTTRADAGVTVANLAEGWRQGRVQDLLKDVAVDARHLPFLLYSLLAGGPDEARQYAGDGPLQVDDRLALEFSAPRALYTRSAEDNGDAIRALVADGPSVAVARHAWSAASAEAWAAAGAMALKADAYTQASDRFQRALALDERHAAALAGFWEAARGGRRTEAARAWLGRVAAAQPDNIEVRVELSKAQAAEGNLEAAATAAADALTRAPDDAAAAEQLAAVFADARDGARLGPLADRMIAQHPDRARPRFFKATALFLTGHTADAIQQARGIVASRPEDVRTQNLLGIACATTGDRACARAAFEAALAADPRDAESHVNLGILLLDTGDAAGALERFSVALVLDRGSAAARQGVDEARAALTPR